MGIKHLCTNREYFKQLYGLTLFLYYNSVPTHEEHIFAHLLEWETFFLQND